MSKRHLLKVIFMIAIFIEQTVEQLTQYQNYSQEFKLIITEDEYKIQAVFSTQYYDGGYREYYVNCSGYRDWCLIVDSDYETEELCLNSTCSGEITEITITPETVSPWSTSAPSQKKSLDTIDITLGSLVGLLVIFLVLITIGWVWTCCRLKKIREECQLAQARLEDNKSKNTSDTIRQFHNPTYTGSPSPANNQEIQKRESAYEVVPPIPKRSTSIRHETPTKHGHEYETVDRGLTRQTTTPLRQKTSVDGNRQSRLSTPVQERGSKIQEEEQHIYHVLESPNTNL